MIECGQELVGFGVGHGLTVLSVGVADFVGSACRWISFLFGSSGGRETLFGGAVADEVEVVLD